MIWIIKTYLELQRKEYNLFWLFLIYLLIPAIFTGIVWFFARGCVNDLFKQSWSDIITMFSIINGFLLSSISIVIANTPANPEQVTKKGTTVEKVSRMKKIMMYDILFQILFIIPLCLLVIYIKSGFSTSIYLGYFTVYLWFISLAVMTILTKRFMYYQSYLSE